MGHTKIIQVCQNDFFLFVFLRFFISIMIELFHYTHFLCIHPNRAGLLNDEWFYKSRN